MVLIPFGFECGIIHFVDPEQGKRRADRVQWTRFADVQRGLRWPIFQPGNELELARVKSLHLLSLIQASAARGPHLSASRGINAQ